jgi:hypothetical protein
MITLGCTTSTAQCTCVATRVETDPIRKRLLAPVRQGNRWVLGMLGEVVWVITRTKDNYQDAQDDPFLAAIHHIVRLVAEVRTPAYVAERGGIRVSGADTEVGGGLVHAMDLALLPRVLGDPIMPRDIGLG